MKTAEEIRSMIEQSAALQEELASLTDEELSQVSGGAGFIRYTIRSGDTLWDLAQKCHTTVDIIWALNRTVIKDPSKIWPGMVITLPWPY